MFETSRTAAKQRRRIPTRYPEHVDEIAGIYVRSEDINDRTSREIRGSIPEYSCTYDGIVSRCRGADCEAALKALRKIAADDGDMSRERHSMPTLRWGPDSLEALVAAHRPPCRLARQEAEIERLARCPPDPLPCRRRASGTIFFTC